MGVRERIAAVFAFSTLPVTILTIIVYAAVFVSVAVLDELPAVPSGNKQLGLNIDTAYDDLHKVRSDGPSSVFIVLIIDTLRLLACRIPTIQGTMMMCARKSGKPKRSVQRLTLSYAHFVSYILGRVKDVASSSSSAHVEDDRTSNVTFGFSENVQAYFEGSNVLAKINGTKPELNSVLFSAHFDSVSTAPGATDDGMGVATLLSLAEYFSKHQPKRTVVFNINNAEEDGLYGAHA